MKMNRLLVGLTMLLVVSTMPTWGDEQDICKEGSWKLGESVDSITKLQKINPATLQIVSPDEGENTYGIKAGLQAKCTAEENTNRSTYYSLNLNVDRNTQTDKESNVYSLKGGWAREYSLKDDPVYSGIIGVDFGFQDDEIKDLEALTFAAGVVPFRLFGVDLDTDSYQPIWKFPGTWHYYPELRIGTDYAVSVPEDQESDSYVVRTWFQIPILWFPFWEAMCFEEYKCGDRLALNYTGQFGAELVDKGIYETADDNWVLNKASVSLFLTEDKVVSLAFSYVNGEDRLKDKEREKYNMVSLNFQYPGPKD